MKRRQFLAVLTGATVMWARGAVAQQPAIPVIGLLSATSSGDYNAPLAGFHDGLNSAGFIAGRNVLVEYR